jgi:hypothetical protein
MRDVVVEIYSDQTNAAVLRHPNRKFPGVLLQGDTLYAICQSVDEVCNRARDAMPAGAYEELNDLRHQLWSMLNHYKAVLGEHRISLPFSEGPVT